MYEQAGLVPRFAAFSPYSNTGVVSLREASELLSHVACDIFCPGKRARSGYAPATALRAIHYPYKSAVGTDQFNHPNNMQLPIRRKLALQSDSRKVFWP